MCGIFGIIAPDAAPRWRAKVLRQLTLATEERGKDSTGLAWFGENGIRMIKKPVPAKEFVEEDEFIEVMDASPEILIGHCRAKTKGSEKNNANNHPIQSKNTGLTIVHNGSVRDGMWRATDDNEENPYIYQPFDAEVDSEAILRLIETMLMIPRNEDLSVSPEVVANTPKEDWVAGVDLMKAIDDATYNLNGNQACALLDPESPNTIYLWRHTYPINIAYIPDYRAIVFASTDSILKKGLQEKNTEWHLNFFWEDKIQTPDKILSRAAGDDYLIRISWTGAATGNEFDIETRKIEPGEADVFGFNKRETSFEASKGTVDTKTAN